LEVGIRQRRRVNREGEGGRIWWMYLAYVYENRTMKPIEIVLKRREEEIRENNSTCESN
jgi:hypothetical protein